MPASLLVFCFMYDKVFVINHPPSLDSMFFFLPEKYIFLLSLFSGRDICCSAESIKDRKFEKYCSTSSYIFNLFYNVIYFLYISTYVTLIQIKEKIYQKHEKFVLYISFERSACACFSFSVFLDKRCISCLAYLFVISLS